MLAGVVMALVALVADAPGDLDPRGMRVLGVAILMATLWITEALPIPVTSLLPLLLFPLLGVLPSDLVAREYANDLIYLFFGGFFLALALERWQREPLRARPPATCPCRTDSRRRRRPCPACPGPGA